MHEVDSRVNLILKKMKNFARLILFFSLCFIILFAAAVLLRFLSSWAETIRIIPANTRPGEDAAAMAWKIIPAVIYMTMLLSLSYSARKNMAIPLSIFSVVLLGCVFSIVVSLGLSRTEVLNPALKTVQSIRAGPGLILSRHGNVMVLLRESGETRGPRVVSIPERKLIYQEVPLGPNNTVLELPDLPFVEETPWFVRSLTLDFTLSAGEMKNRYEENFLFFAAYIFSLILLLGSLRFLLELSQWPLANIFLGALVYRLILSLEIFLNTAEINALLGSFLSPRISSVLITPFVFAAMGILLIIYTLLSRLARPGKLFNEGRRSEGSRMDRYE